MCMTIFKHLYNLIKIIGATKVLQVMKLNLYRISVRDFWRVAHRKWMVAKDLELAVQRN